MSFFNEISKSFEIAISNMKSSEIEIDELKKYSKIDVPFEYLEIIREN